ncbi:MAG: Fimbrial protein pilin [Francisellaceae bacterium]|nr:Fimbrial protein pilin [Francisellaceae bacterium]
MLKMNSNKGFSLIELMIVIAIIGILAAIAIPNYKGYVMRSKLTEGLNDSRIMRTQIEEYFNVTGGLPCCGANVGTPTGGPADWYNPSPVLGMLRWNGVTGTSGAGTKGNIEMWVNTTLIPNTVNYPIFLLQAKVVNNQLTWQCALNLPYDDIPHQYLPNSCLNTPW